MAVISSCERRRKFVPSDVYHEINRVKRCIDNGLFGNLSHEQIGKLHKELWAIERTFQIYMDDNISIEKR